VSFANKPFSTASYHYCNCLLRARDLLARIEGLRVTANVLRSLGMRLQSVTSKESCACKEEAVIGLLLKRFPAA